MKLLVGLLFALSGCAHICATDWEITTSTERNEWFGPSVSASSSVGGHFTREYCDK